MLTKFKSFTSKTHREITKSKCKVCGKITAINQPYGEGTGGFPRKHKINGKICKGCFKESELIDVPLIYKQLK